MIKFCALNSNDASLPSDEDGQPVMLTREAQEEQAYTVYKQALECLKKSQRSDARDKFKELLTLPFVDRADPDSSYESSMPPGLVLKYVSYKNLGAIEVEEGNLKDGMEAYLEAVEIDSTDVTMWYKIGTLAVKLLLFPLARFAFDEGLKCNPQHWPCLNNLISMLYVLNDYPACLEQIGKALSIESGYVKGLVLRDRIFKEHPGLKCYTDVFFKECDPCIFTATYTKEEGQVYIDELLKLREKRREANKPKKPPILPLQKPLSEQTWKALGNVLVEQYEYIKSASPSISLTCRIDLQSTIADLKGNEEEGSESAKAENGSPVKKDSGLLMSASVNKEAGPHQDVNLQAHQSEHGTPMEVDDPNLITLPGTYPPVIIHQSPTFLNPLEEIIPEEGAPVMQGRRGKRRRLVLENIDPSAKRRSARVRNTLKKTQEIINYQELLLQFLPSSLLSDPKEELKDDREDSIPSGLDLNSDHTYGMTPTSSRPAEEANTQVTAVANLESSEMEDVKQFVEKHTNEYCLIDLMYDYLLELSARDHFLWPQGLAELFVTIYNNLRSHIIRPSLFSSEDSEEIIKEHCLMTLIFCELLLDKFVAHNVKPRSMSISPAISPRSPGNQLGPDFPTNQFLWDLEFLLQSSVRQSVFENKWFTFVARTFWLQAHFHLLKGEMEISVRALDRVLDEILAEKETGDSNFKVEIVNCTLNNVITQDLVKHHLESLQRCQSLEEVHRLFENGNFVSVVDLLIQTFNKPPSKNKRLESSANIPERHSQLLLLRESLWKLKDFQGCLFWGEASLNESLNQYLSASTPSLKHDWANTITIILSDIYRCVKEDRDLLGFLENSKLIRMTHNIIKLVSVQMDVHEACPEMAIHTVLPWNLLYYIIEHEEIKIRNLAAKSKSNEVSGKSNCDPSKPSEDENKLKQIEIEPDLGRVMPSSLMLLFTAHEYLGRRSWCTVSDGILLYLCIDVMMAELQRFPPSRPHPFHEELTMGLEQCFYCLYGHPNRRGRVKHLQEHSSRQISMNWERAVQLFNYFKPSVLPEFDSYRTSTVSSDLENLLRRISTLVPLKEDPNNLLDSIVAYIEGGTEKFPSLPGRDSVSPVVAELYYLLGDYYFKNKEFGKAIRFYMLDICINPDRLDSWAGMALSRSSQLEQRINSCEVKGEGTIYRRSVSALRCFKHALQVDPTNAALWIEYGSLSYMLMSHTSRQMKQHVQFSLSEDMVSLLSKKKNELLLTSKNCYELANQCEDEGTGNNEMWLNHYLLGKITHKLGQHPSVYLEHMYLSLHHLNLIGARYPKKILYHNPPPLSIEALELYYKIHSLCLKFLLKNEDKVIPKDELEAVKKYIKLAEESPFASFQEKRYSERDGRFTSMSSSEAEESSATNGTVKRKKKQPAPTADHDYFHQELSSAQSEPSKPPSSVGPGPRLSIDSSSESQDCAAVKELLNSLITVVSERTVEFDISEPVTELGDQVCIKSSPEAEAQKPKSTDDANASEQQESVMTGEKNSQPKETDSAAQNTEVKIEVHEEEMVIDEENKDTGENESCEENENSEANAALKTEEASQTIEKVKMQDGEIKMEAEESNVSSDKEEQNESEEDTLKDENEKQDVEEREGPNDDDDGKTQQDTTITEETSEVDSEELKEQHDTKQELMKCCITAMKECVTRFAQHFKSLYYLAKYFCKSKYNENLQLSYDYLLSSGQNQPHMPTPGLFAERKNTNFFTGIWHTPGDEIDRPGSFATHMYRSIVLLLEVLKNRKDTEMLAYLTVQLSRTPELEKKYMRDGDRIHIAKEVFEVCITLLRNNFNNLVTQEPPPEQGQLISALLDIYKAWQIFQKASLYLDDVGELLEETYTTYMLSEVETPPSVLEQAIAFCQKNIGKMSDQQVKDNLTEDEDDDDEENYFYLS